MTTNLTSMMIHCLDQGDAGLAKWWRDLGPYRQIELSNGCSVLPAPYDGLAMAAISRLIVEQAIANDAKTGGSS